MKDWIVIDKQNLPEFEEEVILATCDPQTGKQLLHLGYLCSITKKGPHFKCTGSSGELFYVTHYRKKPEFPEKIILKKHDEF